MSGSKLRYRTVKRRRSRALVMILLPALIFIGVVGWFMYAMDNKKPARRRIPQGDGVTFLPIVFEEQNEIRMRNATSNR